MSEKMFRRILIAITIVGAVVTAVLIIWTAYLYSNCSIISFIARGR